MKHIRQTKRFNRRPIIVAIVVIVLLVAAAAAFAYKHHIDSSPTSYDKKPKIDYSPATNEEKADSEQHKEDSTKTEDTPPVTDTTTLTAVTPVIVDASQYDNQVEVRAYTSGIFEDGGTCTVTFTQSSLKVTKQVPASKDATTTRCTNLTVDRAEFAQPGQWTVIVTYTSSTAQGSSQSRILEVK